MDKFLRRTFYLILPIVLFSFVTSCSSKTYTITFDAGEGAHFIDNEKTKTIQVKANHQITFPTIPIKEGNTFESAYAFKDWGVKNLPKASKNETFTATFETKKSDNCTYPQTLVSDQNVLKALNDITETDYRGYKLYNGKRYYEYTSLQDYVSDNGRNIHKGDTNYYEVEKIAWLELDPIDPSYNPYKDEEYQLLLTEKIIDNQAYKEDASSLVKPYPNNYKESDIRKWLNDTDNFEGNSFLWRAFIDSSFIPITEVDNSVRTTSVLGDNPYVCENTFDKIFSLSYMDYFDGYFPFHQDKIGALTTDFARARGAYFYTQGHDFDPTIYKNYGHYFTRSPNAAGYKNVSIVEIVDLHAIEADASDVSVRPAMNIIV